MRAVTKEITPGVVEPGNVGGVFPSEWPPLLAHNLPHVQKRQTTNGYNSYNDKTPQQIRIANNHTDAQTLPTTDTADALVQVEVL